MWIDSIHIKFFFIHWEDGDGVMSTINLNLRDILWLREHGRRHFSVIVPPGVTVAEAEGTVTVSPVTPVMVRGHVEVTHCHAELVRNDRVLVMIEAVVSEASGVSVQLGEQLRG